MQGVRKKLCSPTVKPFMETFYGGEKIKEEASALLGRTGSMAADKIYGVDPTSTALFVNRLKPRRADAPQVWAQQRGMYSG